MACRSDFDRIWSRLFKDRQTDRPAQKSEKEGYLGDADIQAITPKELLF